MITWTEVLIRLALAAFFGGLIGIERERKEWAAGLRTHMMVCVGSTLAMMVSAFGFSEILGTPNVVLDPSRIAAQVISGVGFIGAGTILFLRQQVIRGLTTAAGLWTVSAIGLATGGGMYFAAGAATAIVIIILWILKPIEVKLFRHYKSQTLRVKANKNSQLLSGIQEIFNKEKIQIGNLSIENTEDSSIILLRLNNLKRSGLMTVIIEKLQAMPDVKGVYWDNNL